MSYILTYLTSAAGTLSHIVLVHYREVKGNRTNFNHVKETVPYSNEAEEIARHSDMENSVSSSFNPSNYHMQSQATDATSLSSAQASEFEDVESAFYNQASSRLQPMAEKINPEFSDAYYPIPFSNDYQEKLSTIPGVDFSELTQAYKTEDSIDAGDTYEPRKDREFALWDDAENSVTGIQSLSFQPSFSATHSDTIGNFPKQENEMLGHQLTDSFDKRLVYGIEINQGPTKLADFRRIINFNRWMSKELEDVDEPQMQSSSGAYWDTVESENEVDESSVPLQVRLDSYMLGPSLSHDQLFSIVDFSPNWAYENSEIKVLITGRFLKVQHAESCKWSCMFGKLKFLLRLACSEVREFEYRVAKTQDVDSKDYYSDCSNETLNMRFGKLLSLSSTSPNCDPISTAENSDKLAGGGKGPSVLDEGGQGVLHFGAALGYDWVLLPTITAGVSVNFRDVNGWTALHWAAFCGRERTVASLLSLGAAPGALTDPTTKYPTGETPADLASEQGHKGIAGREFCRDFQEQKQFSASSRDGELTDGLSLRNSLTAVCNATQAAARIHQVFRVQSFQRKQLKEYNGDKFGISNERALSLIGVKSHKAGKRDQQVDAAAIRIQNKFRSWKGRKDFLIIRQRIVKIQAHVRGHQVRKNYRKIVWSVGIVEKIILRWRRKGSGLRGFKPEPLPVGPSMQVSSSKDDDYDVLKEGRKQTEERLQKALARVKSMVQYPEARDQYHRLLNVVTEIQETKVLNSSEGTSAYMDDDLADIEALFDDDIFMPTAPS
ncbi:hypothetical protein M0R45_000703 [Rubus argutus]|uniref:Calmodulin-binding transcription activator 3 n=1 Tax=Rubus argutus TaxID=59490 RepID=A0AAW1VNP1_RUBAR